MKNLNLYKNVAILENFFKNRALKTNVLDALDIVEGVPIQRKTRLEFLQPESLKQTLHKHFQKMMEIRMNLVIFNKQLQKNAIFC